VERQADPSEGTLAGAEKRRTKAKGPPTKKGEKGKPLEKSSKKGVRAPILHGTERGSRRKKERRGGGIANQKKSGKRTGGGGVSAAIPEKGERRTRRGGEERVKEKRGKKSDNANIGRVIGRGVGKKKEDLWLARQEDRKTVEEGLRHV